MKTKNKIFNLYMEYKLNRYFNFMKEQKIVSSAFIIVCASMINGVIRKLADEIILPYSKGNFVKINVKEYIGLLLYMLIVTFILFLFIDYFE